MTLNIARSGHVVTKYLAESPTDNHTQFKRSAALYNIASKTALVAATLIAAATTATVLMGLTLTGAASFGLLGGILITPLLILLSSHWGKKSKDAFSKAQIEGDVALILKEISTWSVSKLENYFKEHNIPLLDPADLKQRLILIARFEFWKTRALQTYRTALLNLDREYKDSDSNNNIAIIDSSQTDTEIANQLRYEARNFGYALLERETFPAILQSALMLQLIANPFQDLEISTIGHMTPKPMPYRLSERLFDNKDIFLVFEDSSRKPLGCQEITHLFLENSSDTIRQRMFD